MKSNDERAFTPKTSGAATNKTTCMTAADRQKKMMGNKGVLKIGAVFEGQVSYTVLRLIRNPGKHGEYYVKLDDEIKLMKLGPISTSKLKWIGEVLKKVKKLVGTNEKERKYVLEYFEYGQSLTNKTSFLVTNAYGLQIYELKKALKIQNFSPGCAINIALQSLEGIRILHSAGLINRNIKPSSFSIGYGAKEREIYLSDFRITRQHFEEGTNKNPRPPRPKVAWIGTSRYASIAAMKGFDQGRKDDLESWVYMIYHLFDANALPWKRQAKFKTLQMKEMLKSHAIPDVYKTIPLEFIKLLDLISSWSYASEPDYEALRNILIAVAQKNQYDLNCCDWAEKLTPMAEVRAIVGCDEKSADDICSGEDDFEEGGKRKFGPGPGQRSGLKVNDVLRNSMFTWRIVSKLGHGGFGDVYKVCNERSDQALKPPELHIKPLPTPGKVSSQTSIWSPVTVGNGPQCSIMGIPASPNLQALQPVVLENEKDRKKTYYAMKTEPEDGKKIMLRLKVEMQVFLAITAQRQAGNKNLRHFVEFVDRGKSEELRCKFIVMSLVGPSLDDCRRKYKMDLSFKTTPYNIAIQTLEAIKHLHHIGFLHRDVKPANFAIGIGLQENLIFMLDFGISRAFIDKKTGQHVPPRKVVKFLGTPRFASRASLSCQDQGRRDDLESWLYMMLDIMDVNNGLIWKSMSDREDILQAKINFFQMKNELPKGSVARNLTPLVPYIRGLEYYSTPEYDSLARRLFQIAEASGNPILSMKKVEWAGKLKVLMKDDHVGMSETRTDLRSGSDNEES